MGGSAGPVAALPLRVHAGTRAASDRGLAPDRCGRTRLLQGEVEVPGDRVLAVDEIPRKISSCPYLFVWNGSRFEFVADFGGVGGLGYYLGAGQLRDARSDRVRAPAALDPQDGHYVLQSLTPLEEVTYFDEAKLLAIDHPIGTRVYPNEMAAIGVAAAEFRDVLLASSDRAHRG